MKKQFNHFLKLFDLKTPPGYEWSPGILGTLIPMVKANPIKLTIFSPLYLTASFVALTLAVGVGLVDYIQNDIKKKEKDQKQNYIKNLTTNLTIDKHEDFKQFIIHNQYNDDNSLIYHIATNNLVKNANQEGLEILLNNIHFEKEFKSVYISETESYKSTPSFSVFIDDIFYSLTYNLPFLKKIMDEKVLENCAKSHQKEYELKVKYYKNNIPYVLAAKNRRSDSSVADTVAYLNTFPDTIHFVPSTVESSAKNKM
jgi:hypothetical protein